MIQPDFDSFAGAYDSGRPAVLYTRLVADLAARLARVPVVLDGFACSAAAAVLFAADRRALDHCVVGHLSPEPGHARLLKLIGKEPILNLGMRLGEGSGATLAIQVLKAAIACHTGMATFEEANVSGRSA